MITKLLVLSAFASIPLLAALQQAPTEGAPKSDGASSPKISSTSAPFTHDAKPLKLGDRVELFNGQDTRGWKAFVPDLAKDGKDPI